MLTNHDHVKLLLHLPLVLAIVVTHEEFNAKFNLMTDVLVILERLRFVQIIDPLEKLLLQRRTDIGLEHTEY